MIRVRVSPRGKILEIVKFVVTRSDVASRLGITYWSSRYWMDKLTEEGFLRKEVVGKAVRRVYYYPVEVVVYYRTMFGLMFYTEKPRTHSPDPIAEFRVTVVSNKRDIYNLDEFGRAVIYVGVILAPQTYWIVQKYEVTASEKDEAIDPDELEWSVPVFKRLNYAERYAVFFKSRKREEERWRNVYPDYWLDEKAPLPLPRKREFDREGDVEYDEAFIKDIEKKMIALGRLNMRFNNERGEMESVT